MRARRIFQVTVGTSLVGVVGLLVMTRWGIGTSPDSVHYIRAARYLLGEQAGQSASGALTQYAPLYPLLLAAGGLVGLDPLDGARWLNALLFGLNIFLVGYIVRRSSRGMPWLWVVGSVLALGSMPMLLVHGAALTEPLFLALSLIGLSLLALHLETASQRALVAAAVAVGLAFFTRYAGAACILAGAATILLLSPRPIGLRVRDVLIFGVISSLPMAIWMLRNLSVSSTATGREFVFHPIGRSEVWQAVYTVSSWVLIPTQAPNVIRLAVLLLGLGVVLGLLRHRAAGSRARATGQVLALFALIYGAFLALSVSFLDANTTLDDRTLVPVFVAGVPLVLLVLDDMWRTGAPRAVVLSLLILVIALSAAQTVRGAGVVAERFAKGWGFTSLEWRRSATVAQVRRLPGDALIYSNAPEILYLHTGRDVQPLPRKQFLMTRQPNRDFPIQINNVGIALREDCGVVVYFRHLAQPSLPSLGELTTTLSLRVLADEVDGSVLGVVTCPQ